MGFWISDGNALQEDDLTWDIIDHSCGDCGQEHTDFEDAMNHCCGWDS